MYSLFQNPKFVLFEGKGGNFYFRLTDLPPVCSNPITKVGSDFGGRSGAYQTF